MPEMVDRTGQRFGRLVAMERADANRHGKVRWLCQCDCGQRAIVIGSVLGRGTTRSCGCLNLENARARADKYFPKTGNFKHGLSRSGEYKIWAGMKCRCNTPSATHFENYGGRGVGLDDPLWVTFVPFYTDMGPRPSPKHSLDRIDNDKGYSKSNCRWATTKEQRTNQRARLTDAR